MILDSGNWSVDLQAGSEYGYKLLFVVLLAGVMAVVFQVICSFLFSELKINQFVYLSFGFSFPRLWRADSVVLQD